jgi:hypothetical protein
MFTEKTVLTVYNTLSSFKNGLKEYKDNKIIL